MTAGRLIRPFATVAILLFVSSCTMSCKAKEGGAKEMAENLKTHLEMNLVDGITRVTCPPNAKQKKGKKYDCTVYFKGGKTSTVMMEWVDHSLFKAFLVLSAKDAEKEITDGIKKQGGKIKSVTCPKRMVLKPKSKYTCSAVNTADVKRDIAVTVDAKGGYRWDVVNPKGPATKPPVKPADPKKAAPAAPAKPSKPAK